MKPLEMVGATMAVAVSLMSSTAHAQLVNWHVEGEVSALTAVNNRTGATSAVSQLGALKLGQTFESDVTVDLASDSVKSITVQGGSAGESWTYDQGPSSTYKSTTQGPGVAGWLKLTTDAMSVMSFQLALQGSGVPSTSYTLQDLNDALLAHDYGNIVAIAGIGLDCPKCYLGHADLHVTFSSLSAVPEPGPATLLGLGMTGLFSLAARRRQGATPR